MPNAWMSRIHLTVHLPSMAFWFSIRSLPFSTIIPTKKWVIPHTDRNQEETSVKSFCLIFSSFSFFLTHSFVWTRKMLGGDFLDLGNSDTWFYRISHLQLCSSADVKPIFDVPLYQVDFEAGWNSAKTLVGNILKEDKHC